MKRIQIWLRERSGGIGPCPASLYNAIVWRSGKDAAHHLVEHQRGLGGVGTLTDELVALGAWLYGQQGLEALEQDEGKVLLDKVRTVLEPEFLRNPGPELLAPTSTWHAESMMILRVVEDLLYLEAQARNWATDAQALLARRALGALAEGWHSAELRHGRPERFRAAFEAVADAFDAVLETPLAPGHTLLFKWDGGVHAELEDHSELSMQSQIA